MLNKFETPILFLVFNRPFQTLKSLIAIKKVKPSKLYIVADGPRKNNSMDQGLCEKTRNLILNNIDWDCELVYDFRQENLGCGFGIYSAITWFFGQEEKGIIIEDDCVLDKSFFFFATEMLNKYENSDDIAIISAMSPPNVSKRKSYGFVHISNIWGWATWKSTWEKYDYNVEFKENDEIKECIKNRWNTEAEQDFWIKMFRMMNAPEKSWWDFQLAYTIFKNNLKCIVPTKNLVKNIGIGANSTHTRNASSPFIELKLEELAFPLKHPEKIERNLKFENKLLKRNLIDMQVAQKYTIIDRLRDSVNYRIIRHFSKEKEWKDIEYFDDSWKYRIQVMSKYIKSDDSILDLGCGEMWLMDYLTEANIYFPVDYKRRSSKSLVYDFNKYEFPNKNVDVSFVSGCLEYVEDYEWFIEEIGLHSRRCIISYCTLDKLNDIGLRKSYTWVNHLTEKELINYFLKYEFKLTDSMVTELDNSIFIFDK